MASNNPGAIMADYLVALSSAYVELAKLLDEKGPIDKAQLADRVSSIPDNLANSGYAVTPALEEFMANLFGVLVDGAKVNVEKLPAWLAEAINKPLAK